jgi:hypothetical protein
MSESALTNSFARNGEGGMLAAFEFDDGSEALPGISFTQETGSGLYRAAANDVEMSVGGASVQKWSPLGAQIFGDLIVDQAVTVTGALSVTGAVTLPNASLTRKMLPAVGAVKSTSSGAFSTTSVAAVDVTNLTVGITSQAGRPIVLSTQPDESANPGFFAITATAGGPTVMLVYLIRDSGTGPTTLAITAVTAPVSTKVYIPSFSFIDAGTTAGDTYTYKIQIQAGAFVSAADAAYLRLVAYEL